MSNKLLIAVVITVVSQLPAPVLGQIHDPRAIEPDPRTATGPLAPVLEGLGSQHVPVTTSVAASQQFFDQGLKLTYGFNHSEALRAFKEAARLDPDNAMAYWGWALALGPNLNLPMQPEVVHQAYEAMQLALARKDKASAKERAFIEALAARYSDDPEADRGPLDKAYADAMAELHAAYPEDNEAATLYAAALMNLNPWGYWDLDGRPVPNTTELLGVLETVIDRDPTHAGARHYYIHAVEARDPQLAEQSADELAPLAPGAGHLVHMPSHIYMRVGRYADSYQANFLATRADERYINQCRAQGMYPLGYYPHNVHFMAWAAMMQGRGKDSLKAARKVTSTMPPGLTNAEFPYYESFMSQPLFTMVRFGMWEQVMAEPKPADHARFMTGIWHYARGMAKIHSGERRNAQRELKMLKAILDEPALQEPYAINLNFAPHLLMIAVEILSGEIDAKRQRFHSALAHLERAVRLQEGLVYAEPPDWYFPARHVLGAVLLEAGFPAEAEVVYWSDLRKNPENGFSLFGLKQAIEAQGKDASSIEVRFREAWVQADAVLGSSRF